MREDGASEDSEDGFSEAALDEDGWEMTGSDNDGDTSSDDDNVGNAAAEDAYDRTVAEQCMFDADELDQTLSSTQLHSSDVPRRPICIAPAVPFDVGVRLRMTAAPPALH